MKVFAVEIYKLTIKVFLQVLVKGVMDNNTDDVWVDEEHDVRVENMILLISGSTGKIFEKHFWEDKGLLEGPKKMVEEEDGQPHNEESRPLKKKHNDDALKTYFILNGANGREAA